MTYMARQDLHRVLQSVLQSELEQSRRRGPRSNARGLDVVWPESMRMGEEGSPSLGCDSIERLWLAGAVNEMFCLYDARTENGLDSAASFGGWLDIVDRGWNQQGQRITFTTSGSTGVPKRCTHAVADLQREVRFLGARFRDAQRVIALAPPHHIFVFLFTALLPAESGIRVLAAEDLSPGALTETLSRGDLIVATPLRWEWLLRSIGPWPEGVHGVCSTAPCPAWLKQQLVEGGLASFTEVYGSSETAGIGVRTYPAERYTLMPHWTWAERDVTAPRLRDHAGNTVLLQDRLEVSPDGSFRVGDRQDGAVQIGGVNVFPSRIEELLRSVSGVADAAVRLSTSAGSQRLKAFVVPDSSVREDVLAENLDAWSKEFSAPERVTTFTFGQNIPKNGMGKRIDWE